MLDSVYKSRLLPFPLGLEEYFFGEKGQDGAGVRLCFWGGSSALTPWLGKISGEKCQNPGMNWCLFWWRVYSGWVNKQWGHIPPREHIAVMQFSRL